MPVSPNQIENSPKKLNPNACSFRPAPKVNAKSLMSLNIKHANVSYDYKRSLTASYALGTFGKREIGVVPPYNKSHLLNPLAETFWPSVWNTENPNAYCTIDGTSLCNSPFVTFDFQIRPAYDSVDPKLKGDFEELTPTSSTMPTNQPPWVRDKNNVYTPALSDFSGLGHASKVRNVRTNGVASSLPSTIPPLPQYWTDVTKYRCWNPNLDISHPNDIERNSPWENTMGAIKSFLPVFKKDLNAEAKPFNPRSEGMSDVGVTTDNHTILNGNFISEGSTVTRRTENLSHDVISDRNFTQKVNPPMRENEKENYENSIFDVTPAVQEFRTPDVSHNETQASFVSTQTVCVDEGDARVKGNNNLEKYVSDPFCSNNNTDNIDTDNEDVSQVLKQIRIDNVNKVIIGHLNVNFFAKKLDAIKTIIPGNVDIMVFSETKLDSSYPMAQLSIEGFGKPFRFDRNAFGGGLLIYVRSDIPCKQLSEHVFSDKIEGIFIEINLRKSKWLLLVTYHPPSQNDKFYFDNIGRALDIYTQKYDKILLTGDFNAEESEVTISNFMELYDLKNLVKEKTCFKSLQNPSCVDLFLTNCYRSFQKTKVICTGISDCHKMIITVLKTTFQKSKPREIVYRSYRNFNQQVFKEYLRCNLQGCKTYSEFESKFLEILNLHAPLKRKLVRANEVPYMTKILRKGIANRSRLENRYYRDKSDESLRAYKKQKNFCSRLYKKERKKYYTNLDLTNITDSKRFWKTTKPFFSDKGIGKTEITLIEGDKILQDDLEVATVMNTFFGNAVKSLNISVPGEYKKEISVPSENDLIDNIISTYADHPSIKLINDNVVKGTFSFSTVSVEAVDKEIAALDSKKAYASSSIPPKFLNENSDVCCEPLAVVINNDISNSCFDSGLKLADLTPIHKGEEATNKKNYRNVSLLPVVSKIFEKLLQPQILAYVEKFLSPFLCGYRKGYSPQYALLCMLEKWRMSIDKGGYGGGVLMDLSKAFDTLDHDLLIAKLFAYGFGKNALKFIKSYLSNRWQRVKINGSYSSWAALLVGVPQGSVLGPLLFNLYINDLFYLIKTDICNFADDTTPYCVGMCLSDLMDKLEGAANDAIEWFRYNAMKLNSDKCHLIVCGHKFECMVCKIENTQVIETHLVKLLGVKIESELTFDNYLRNVCKKASQKLNALSRLCSIIPFHKRKMLMRAFFLSLFSYCPLVWMCHSRGLSTKINNLHYRALRIAYRDETSSFEQLLEKDESVTIHNRNLQSLVIEMYKALKGISPAFMGEVFGKKSNIGTEHVSANTRSQKDFYNPVNPRTVSNGLESIRSLGPKIWEMVPTEIRNISSLLLFKLEVKKWIPQSCPCRNCKRFVPQLGFM